MLGLRPGSDDQQIGLVGVPHVLDDTRDHLEPGVGPQEPAADLVQAAQRPGVLADVDAHLDPLVHQRDGTGARSTVQLLEEQLHRVGRSHGSESSRAPRVARRAVSARPAVRARQTPGARAGGSCAPDAWGAAGGSCAARGASVRERVLVPHGRCRRVQLGAHASHQLGGLLVAPERGHHVGAGHRIADVPEERERSLQADLRAASPAVRIAARVRSGIVIPGTSW